MDLLQYLRFCKSTAVYPKIIVLKNPTEDQIKRCEAAHVELENISWVYPLIGLLGEAGELANKLKKVIRDDKFVITPEKHDQIADEKSDLYWYSVILDYELRLNPNLVLELNVDKLTARKEKNQIHDKGDRKDG